MSNTVFEITFTSRYDVVDPKTNKINSIRDGDVAIVLARDLSQVDTELQKELIGVSFWDLEYEVKYVPMKYNEFVLFHQIIGNKPIIKGVLNGELVFRWDDSIWESAPHELSWSGKVSKLFYSALELGKTLERLSS